MTDEPNNQQPAPHEILQKLEDVIDTLGKRQTLWVTDAELIRRMGVPEKIMRRALRSLDENRRTTGFPAKQKLFGDRRYWPAVLAYFEANYGFKPEPSQQGRRGR